jgi:hypothetical protein
METTVTPPQNVVRFYSNLEYALQCVGFKEIALLHADKLNDPFDPPFYFVNDFDNSYMKLIEWVREYHQGDLRTFQERMPEANWNTFVGQIQEYFQSLRRHAFIFSATAVDKNSHPEHSLHMWSHYGNGHRGVAIQFDTTLLARSVIEGTKDQDTNDATTGQPWWPVGYASTPPTVTREAIFQFVTSDKEEPDQEAWLESDLGKIIRSTTRSKSIEWIRENEWRLLTHNEDTRLDVQRVPLLDGTVTALYLGCRIRDDMRGRLIFETRRNFPRAEIFEAQKVERTFSLEFQRVS